MSAESPIRITRHQFAGPKVLLFALFLGLGQGALILSLYLMAAPGLWSHGPHGLAAFLLILLAFWGLGAWRWGRAIDGEGSLAPPMLALTQALAALYGLLWPWLLSFSGWLGKLWDWPESGGANLLLQALTLLPLLAPPAFFWGGALPLLAEMGLKKRQRLEWNLPLISAFRLAGLLGGFAVTALAEFSPNHILWSAPVLLLVMALIILLSADKPERDEYSPEGARRLWPARSLGLWSGEAIQVLDHDLSKSAARPAWLVTFLCALAIGGFISLWGVNAAFILPTPVYDSRMWWLFIPAAMALGGLIIAPQLARQGRPSTVLALAGFLAALGLLLSPWIFKHIIVINYKFLAFLWPCAILGTLLPLAGQVFQARRHWLASSLGLASLWFCWGAALGIFFSFSENFSQATVFYSLAALLAAFLALSPLIGRFMALILWIAAVLALFFFIRPESFRATYRPGPIPLPDLFEISREP